MGKRPPKLVGRHLGSLEHGASSELERGVERGGEGNGGVTLGALGAPLKRPPHDEGRAGDTRERNVRRGL